MYRNLNIISGIPPIPLYTLFLGVSIIAFFLSLDSQAKRYEISYEVADKIKIMVFIAAVFGIFGAAFGEAFYHRNEGKMELSGFTFYGGLVLALISIVVFSRFKGINFFDCINLLVVPLVLAHAFGRIGCFFGGCCFGTPTNTIFGVVFPKESLAFSQYGQQAIHPTQLYESAFLFALYFLLLKVKFNNKFCLYLFTYPIIRLYIEKYRGDNRGVLFFHNLTPSMEISIWLLTIGLILLYHNIAFYGICRTKIEG